jgi:hypothetical protein
MGVIAPLGAMVAKQKREKEKVIILFIKTPGFEPMVGLLFQLLCEFGDNRKDHRHCWKDPAKP